jgi:PIN domain nuclease of toxin-antitoxin system
VNLLDTHAFVWAINDPDRLSPAARHVIENGEFVVSGASLWEMIVKKGRSTALVTDPLPWWRTYVPRTGVKVLPINPDHIEHLDTLPGPNWDPFDRILICQCIVNGLCLVTKDALIRDRYQGHLNCVW